jgi:hypothetical protein
MENFSKSIACVFFFLLSITFIQAQDTLKSNKFKRNTLKLGIESFPVKVCFSYEHAFTKHISVGGMASWGGIIFVGSACNFFTRYYFSGFNKSGWFVEARGTYARYNVNSVYDSTYRTPYEHTHINHYTGGHAATISYISAGFGGGYKSILSKHVNVEFVTELHYGKATFGQDDLYFPRSDVAIYFGGSDDLQTIFNHTGPAFPLDLMINLGFAF